MKSKSAVSRPRYVPRSQTANTCTCTTSPDFSPGKYICPGTSTRIYEVYFVKETPYPAHKLYPYIHIHAICIKICQKKIKNKNKNKPLPENLEPPRTGTSNRRHVTQTVCQHQPRRGSGRDCLCVCLCGCMYDGVCMYVCMNDPSDGIVILQEYDLSE